MTEADMSGADTHYEEASKLFPGGVNSSTRLNRALGFPVYARSGEAGHITDIEGRTFIDMSCSHGAALLGHGHPAITEALVRAARIGCVHSFETEYHIEIAHKIVDAVPCADKVRFCSSGSEATLHLIRACRAFTNRTKIIRFEGHFHGYHELIYIGGHPPADCQPPNRDKPYVESKGIPPGFAEYIIPLPFNDVSAFDEAMDRYGDETALVILEPVNFNCAGIKPEPEFLDHLRNVTRDKGIVLFFDEIQSSFKKSPGGAQQDFGVTPDVCTIGKSLGGGLPLSAFCGRGDIMDMFEPVGGVQHSGTFNAHIVPVLAGLAFLNEIEKPLFYQHLQGLETRFHDAVDAVVDDLGLNMIVPRHGARFNMLLGRSRPAKRFEDTFVHDKSLMLSIIRECYMGGVYFHDYGGGPLHHGFSVAHTNDDMDRVVSVLGDALRKYRDRLSK